MELTEEKAVETIAEDDKKQHKAEKRKKRKKRAKRFFLGFLSLVIVVAVLTAAANTVIYKSLLNKVSQFPAVDNEMLDFEYYDNGCMNIYTDKGLKIVQLTDVHIGAGWMCMNKDNMALNACGRKARPCNRYG